MVGMGIMVANFQRVYPNVKVNVQYVVPGSQAHVQTLFTELQNAQAVTLPYDGLNPLPPQYCYLKPYYLDAQTSYFDHVEQGAL